MLKGARSRREAPAQAGFANRRRIRGVEQALQIPTIIKPSTSSKPPLEDGSGEHEAIGSHGHKSKHVEPEEITPEPTGSNDPWQILVIAVPFYIASLMCLFHRGTGMMRTQTGSRHMSVPGQPIPISEGDVHAVGAVALVVALVITWFYLRLRNEIRRELR